MSVPKNKEELLNFGERNYSNLIEYVENLSQESRNIEFPQKMLNRNVRDVIAHLHHWHLMMLEWYEVGMQGIKPDMPAKGYTWKDTSSLNLEIRNKYAEFELSDILKIFENSHCKILSIIESHSNEELFEKKRFKWTGSTSISVYLRGATSSHYDWALKLIKRARK